MKLWILEPTPNRDKTDDPWNPWYDKAFGFVIRAETEDAARILAHSKAGDENYEQSPWLSPKYSTCRELFQDGCDGVIIREFCAA